jgi:hypothetical protein
MDESELAGELERLGVWRSLPAAERDQQIKLLLEGTYLLNLDVFADVHFNADGEEMAEGRVEEFLMNMAPRLREFGLPLEVDGPGYPERDDVDYVVRINGRECLVWRADEWTDDHWPWFEATVRPFAVVNDLLEAASVPVRVFTLYTGGNDAFALLLDPAVVSAMHRSGLFEPRDIPELAEPTGS